MPDNNEVPLFASLPTSSPDKKLTGFFINLGTIKLQIIFNQPISVPDDFGYSLNIDAVSKFSILQN